MFRQNVGRRGGFEEGLKRCVSRGRRSDFALCDVDVWSLRRRIRGRVANFMSRMCYFAVIISRGSYRTSYASAQLFRGRRSTFEASNWKSLKRIVILKSSVWSTCHFWRKSRRKASFWSFKVSFLKEVSQKSFVFWASKLQFWRKSRRNASFWSFKVAFLKEVSQKSFVFKLHSFNFEGSLAEMLGFWSSKLQFWRKSRRKASFLSLTIQILDNPNHLNLTSLESDINWLSNQLNSAHSLPIGSLSLETSATALCGRYVTYNILTKPLTNPLFICNNLATTRFIPVGHSYLTLLLDTLVGHSDMTCFLDTLLGHRSLTQTPPLQTPK